MDKPEQKIIVSKDGPYRIYGDIPLMVQIIAPNKEGYSWEWIQGKSFETASTYSLCRCGHSENKPFCDGTHRRISFNATEAKEIPFDKLAKVYDGPRLKLSDAYELCALARFCDPEGKIWNLIKHTDKEKARDLVIHEGNYCPAGRLVLHDKDTGKVIEPELKPSIGVVEDPVIDTSGPLWVRGGIEIESHDGTKYEKRNRVTLCRCGASKNKPFCDASHAHLHFDDGLIHEQVNK